METIIEAQIGFIFESAETRPDDLAHSLNREMDNLFDNIPLTVPVPEDPNLDNVPIVHMESKNGIYVCNVARARVDFFMKGNGIQNFDAIKDDFLNKKDQFLNMLFRLYKSRRVAFVIKYFVSKSEPFSSISKLIKDELIKTIPGTPIQSLVNYASMSTISGVNVNNFILIEPFKANIVGVPDEQMGALITRDFNTNIENDFTKLNKDFFDKLIAFGETNLMLNEVQALI